MNEIPTEKLLPQGLQDWLNAKRECMAQANDIHNEINENLTLATESAVVRND